MSCFLSCRPVVVNAIFSTGLVGIEETEETSTPTRPVENVASMTKGLQERKQLLNGTTVENYVMKINNYN